MTPTDAVMDDMLRTIVDITLIPTTIRRAQEGIQDRPIVVRTCPVCRMPHPADVPCKPLERHDNGGY